MDHARRLRTITLLLLVSVLVGAAAGTPSAAAAPPAALERLEPVIDRRTFTALLDQLEIDRDQRVIAELLFSDYSVSLEGLAERLEARELKAGRDRVNDAIAGRALLDRDELRRLRVAVTRAEHSAWPEAAALADELLASTRSLLPEDAVARFDRLAAGVRRELGLRPRLARRFDEDYAGEGVDVAALASEAAAPGGELAGLDPARLAGVLDPYRRDLDLYVRATAEAERQGRLEIAIARIQQDRDAQRRAETAALERWRQLYTMNRQVVDAIGKLAAAALGEDAARAWRDRFDEACFPRLYRETAVDREHEWIERHLDDEAVLRQAATAHQTYAERRAELIRDAVALLLRGRLNAGRIIHPRMDPGAVTDAAAAPIYQALLKNSGQLATLDADTSSTLGALLTDRQRKQMRADIAASAYGRRR